MKFIKLSKTSDSKKDFYKQVKSREPIAVKQDSTPLKKHQKRVLEKLKSNSVLAYHGLGSGKTLTALRAAEQRGGGSVIGPASLKDNFASEAKKHNTKKVDYSTYSKPEPKSKKLLVFDEAHRMGRLESQRSKYPDQFKSDRKLLLTGTPIRNEPSELIPIIRGLGVDMPRNKKKFYKNYVEEKKVSPGILGWLKGVKPGVELKGKNLDKLEQKLEGRVDYHKNTKEDYPNLKEQDVEIEMSPTQYKTYQMAMKGKPDLAYKIKHGLPPSKSESSQMNAFLSATRQISNTPKGYNLSDEAKSSPKLKRMVEDIQKRVKVDDNYKGVTYSNYLDSGIKALSKKLEKSKIPHAVYSGEVPDKKRDKIIKDYNSGKIKQLLISGAGSEGLDLKGTKLLQTMEPHWNNARLKQVKGRVARYKSHADLPEDQRKVDVRNYYSTVPSNKFKDLFFGKSKSTDQYLKMLSDKKTSLNKDFLTTLQAASDPNKTVKDLMKKSAFKKRLRKDMPQLSRKQSKNLANKTVKVKNIKPSQKDFNQSKINRIVKDLKQNGKDKMKPIVVSKDLHIVDGHHRWKAYKKVYGNEATINVKLKNKNGREAIDDMSKKADIVFEKMAQNFTGYVSSNKGVNKKKRKMLESRGYNEVDSDTYVSRRYQGTNKKIDERIKTRKAMADIIPAALSISGGGAAAAATVSKGPKVAIPASILSGASGYFLGRGVKNLQNEYNKKVDNKRKAIMEIKRDTFASKAVDGHRYFIKERG